MPKHKHFCFWQIFFIVNFELFKLNSTKKIPFRTKNKLSLPTPVCGLLIELSITVINYKILQNGS